MEIRHHNEDIPEDEIVTGVVEIVFTFGENGEGGYYVRQAGDLSLSNVIGTMDLAQIDIINWYRKEH